MKLKYSNFQFVIIPSSLLFRPKFLFGTITRPKFEQHISDQIDTLENGALFFVDDFLDFGTAESVKEAFLRLIEKQKIKRLSHGIYYKPKLSKIIAELVSS
jgi:valyl-tRNA synthetase